MCQIQKARSVTTFSEGNSSSSLCPNRVVGQALAMWVGRLTSEPIFRLRHHWALLPTEGIIVPKTNTVPGSSGTMFTSGIRNIPWGCTNLEQTDWNPRVQRVALPHHSMQRLAPSPNPCEFPYSQLEGHHTLIRRVHAWLSPAVPILLTTSP